MSYAQTVAAASGPPRFLGERFDGGGRPLRASGNTVIANLNEGAPLAALTAARDALAATDAGPCFAWLPPSSYHMTLYDGLLHARRERGYWPTDLAMDVTDAEADAFMLARLGACPPPGERAFRMILLGIEAGPGGGVGVAMGCEDAAEEARLRGWRDRLAEAAGLAARPGHAAYAFHVTLAYAVAWADADAAPAFDAALAQAGATLAARLPLVEAWPPLYCHFADMTRFDTVCALG
ncbi:DUF1868 domain-containing protein [Rubrimonas cliftonensis]|uniref:DUF1868 domain-containing protein n=1 Tax=Rubrimonas cliftonensis TaxID=89524 RepID=A0A1H4DHD6_9RHOB|nr:DUF1868 domain-containing protein [Rubrimonas cliftonensis]SEA71916.1 hypothetical protein SAMN05444370_11027 [Rubrimonas cliftonensis]